MPNPWTPTPIDEGGTGGTTPASARRSLGFGVWKTPPYNAGNFTATAGMTWTVQSNDVTVFRYIMLGPKVMVIHFQIENTSVGGTPGGQLAIKIPENRLTKFNQNAWAQGTNNGVAIAPANIVYIETGPNNSVIALTLAPGQTWANSTNLTSVYGQIILELI